MPAKATGPLSVKGKNVPLGTAAQGIYELADGTHSGTACCWDFGNVTTDPTQYGIMNTLFFGTGFLGQRRRQRPMVHGRLRGRRLGRRLRIDRERGTTRTTRTRR